MKKRTKKHNIGGILIVLMFTAWTIIPILLVIMQSIKPKISMFTVPPTLIFKPTMTNFINVFTRQNIGSYILNSFIIGIATTVVCSILGSMAAYALSRFNILGKKWITLLILMTRIVPGSAIMVPMYSFMNQTGILRVSYLPVILAHISFNLPFSICILRSFFDDVPIDLEHAAEIDGCSRIQCFLRVALPITIPGLTSTIILTLLFSWNEFMFALVLSDRTARTLPVGISSFLGPLSTDWGATSAIAVIAMAPIFVAGLLVQKYLVQGMTMGAVKG